jgi:hypothetical protein
LQFAISTIGNSTGLIGAGCMIVNEAGYMIVNDLLSPGLWSEPAFPPAMWTDPSSSRSSLRVHRCSLMPWGA